MDDVMRWRCPACGLAQRRAAGPCWPAVNRCRHPGPRTEAVLGVERKTRELIARQLKASDQAEAAFGAPCPSCSKVAITLRAGKVRHHGSSVVALVRGFCTCGFEADCDPSSIGASRR